DDMRVPTDVLYSMPYPCIYIQTSTTDFGGFFVHFEDDLREGYGMELRFLLMYDGHELPLYLHLKSGATIYDGIKEGQKESRKNAAGWNLPKISQQQVSSLLDGFERIQKALIPQLLQLILYICAENKEVRENSQQAKIHRAPSSPKYIKDKPREIQSWDLGTETAIRLRSLHTYREPSESATPRSGSSAGSTKAPHVRRAHWHHFWTGKHGSKERKRVLKWVAPSFIHANGSAESPFVTVTGISAKKKEEN
ncbi:MAG: hypothetical protein Q4D42_03120, partial [Eubacteriales bacterium]|nr:hypothetical protein [Eubacteriales bacterium]